MILVAVFFLICMVFYALYLGVNFYYFTYGFSSVQDISSPSDFLKVTVVIPARNEELNIGALLQDIANQNYPLDFIQVIVVDDHSTDQTRKIAEEFIGFRKNWKVLSLIKPKGTAYKKAAITQAIQNSDGDIILTTDADCRVGKHWIRTMVSEFKNSTVGLVSGPVTMWDNGTWFQQFQSLEFTGLIAIGAGSMQRGAPNMCNGANLAYRRDAFYEVNGFEGVDHIASGDDELLMHKIYSTSKYLVKFQKSREAIVNTAPCYTFRQFLNQRIRWVSKSTHYKNKAITLIMSCIYLAIAGIPITCVLAITDIIPWWIFISILGIKISSEFIILYSATHFFEKKYLLKWFLPEQLLHIPYILWAGLAGNIGQYKWKDRIIQH